MSSNLFSDSSKLLSIQTSGAFPSFLCLLPHKSCRWWNSQSWPKSFVPSTANSLCSHPLLFSDWLLFSPTLLCVGHKMLWVRNVSQTQIHTTWKVTRWWRTRAPIRGTPSQFFILVLESSCSLLSSQTAGWLIVLYVFWAVSTHKRIRSMLLKSIESKDFTLSNQHGLCFVEPRYQLWEQEVTRGNCGVPDQARAAYS